VRRGGVREREEDGVGDDGDGERDHHDCAPSLDAWGAAGWALLELGGDSATVTPARASASTKSGHVPKHSVSQVLAVLTRSLGMSFRTGLARQ
jgi:hypothetical protein